MRRNRRLAAAVGLVVLCLVAATAALLSGLLPGCSRKPGESDGPDGDIALVVDRGGGMALTRDPFTAYRFSLARDGGWEFTPRTTGEPKRGSISAAEVDRWLKEVVDGGFDRLKSNPKLGQTDGPCMDITLDSGGRRERKRVPVWEDLSKAINRKVVETVGTGK